MKPIDVKSITYIDLMLKRMIKILNLKLVIMLQYQKLAFFVKICTSNWSNEVFAIKNVKNTVPWSYVIEDLNEEEIVGTFYEKELQKTN